MTDTTTLADLLDLQLHKYEEEVKNIVDKSVKEMAMEKVLSDLNNNWKILDFETEIHDRTKMKVIRVSEEILEALEENQVQLQK
jgi:dynein heavy chain, axonemal